MLSKLIEYIGRWSSASGFFRSSNSEDSLGRAGEKAAAKFLKSLGYRIVQQNHLQRRGEIDLIAIDGNTIVFVEVKTWRSNRYAEPSEAVDRNKQRYLTRAALIYLKNKQLLDRQTRFDVLSLVWSSADQEKNLPPTIRHFKHAFEAADI